MIGTIRRHSTWLWVIIITGTIVSFVYFFSPDARYNLSGRRKNAVGFINNRPISNTEYVEILNEAKLRFFFRYGSFPDRADAMAKANFDQEGETNARLLMLEKVNNLNIQAGINATLQFRDELLELATGGKAASAQAALSAFDQQILRPNGLTMADFERFVRHEVCIMHLINLAGVTGQLITPQEGEYIYRREHEEVVAELVVFSASNYIASVTNYPPEALGQTYSNRQAMYTVPERVQVAYVKFDLTNFLEQADQQVAKVTNLTAQIDSIYRQQPTNYFKDKDDKPLSETAAKEKIKKDLRDREAVRLAQKKAYEYVNGFNTDKTNTLADFEALAATNKMTVGVSAPFDKEEGPKDLKVPERFVDMAFSLTESDPVSLNPVAGEEGAYLFALKKRLPREVPTLEAVRDKVINDYRAEQAEEMANLWGKIFYNSLTNGLAQKRAFTEICLESKQQPVILPPFSRSTSTVTNLPPTISLMDVKRAVFNLTPSSASPYIPTSDGGMVVFLRKRFPADENKLRADLPMFLANLRQMRQGEAANEWFMRQRQSIQADLPKPSRDREKRKGS